jgi:molecular chaperone GrpE
VASEHGKFSTDISQSVIDEAMRSVDRSHRDGVAPSPEVSVDAPAAPAPAPPVNPEESAREVSELQAQLDASQAAGREMMERLKSEHEKLLRATADLENFKKRASKEKEEVQKFGNERLLKDFLPIADNIDRALEHARTSSDLEGLRKGIEMTRKLFEDTLGKHGVKGFACKGQPFDPHFHEAMQQVESAELPPNHVVSEVVRGYTLNERLVRPALVVVSKVAAKDPGAPGPSGEPSSSEPPTS